MRESEKGKRTNVSNNVSVSVISSSSSNVGVKNVVLSTKLEGDEFTLLLDEERVGETPLASNLDVLGDEGITLGLDAL